MSDFQLLEKYGWVAAVLLFIVGVWFAYTMPVSVYKSPPQAHCTADSVEITYYVENDTSEIHGPRNLTIDGQEIHVRFVPCHNYTYVNDEPHPCE